MASCVALISFVIIFGGIVYWFVKENILHPYNKGVCRRCGHKLRKMDIFAFCGRGYKCRRCGKMVWISYDMNKRFNY